MIAKLKEVSAELVV